MTATQGRNTLVSSRHNTLLHQMGGFWTHNVIASGIHAVGCMTPLGFFYLLSHGDCVRGSCLGAYYTHRKGCGLSFFFGKHLLGLYCKMDKSTTC